MTATLTSSLPSTYTRSHWHRQERGSGVRALITRVAESIRDWGIQGGYFASPLTPTPSTPSSLAHLLLNQKVAFNSPVWFNVGCDRLRAQLRRPELALESGHRPSRVLRHRLLRSPSAPPASSTPSRTPLELHPSPSPRPRACSSSGAAAPETSPLLHPWLNGDPSPAEALRLRSALLHARLRPPSPSVIKSGGRRPVASPPRWSSSTSTTPISKTSSNAK